MRLGAFMDDSVLITDLKRLLSRCFLPMVRERPWALFYAGHRPWVVGEGVVSSFQLSVQVKRRRSAVSASRSTGTVDRVL